MSTLQVNRINLNSSGNAYIAISGSSNISIGSANTERIYVGNDGTVGLSNSTLSNVSINNTTFSNVIITLSTLNSPNIAGVGLANTPANTTSNNQIATTLFVQNLISVKANTTDYWTGLNNTSPLTANTVWNGILPTTLTDAATINLDLNTGIDFVVTLGGNRTLANPTNAKTGQKGRIRVIQDATGSRTLAYGNQYKFAAQTAPVLTTTALARDHLYYEVIDSTNIFISIVKDIR